MSPRIQSVDGELFRFLVGSESTPGRQYLVDLQADKWNGFCGCWDFECRRAKALREQGRGDVSRCKHIKAVRKWILKQLLTDDVTELLLNGLLEQQAKRSGRVEEKF